MALVKFRNVFDVLVHSPLSALIALLSLTVSETLTEDIFIELTTPPVSVTPPLPEMLEATKVSVVTSNTSTFTGSLKLNCSTSAFMSKLYSTSSGRTMSLMTSEACFALATLISATPSRLMSATVVVKMERNVLFTETPINGSRLMALMSVVVRFTTTTVENEPSLDPLVSVYLALPVPTNVILVALKPDPSTVSENVSAS